MQTIIVTVKGGAIQDISLPPGIEVIVRDYDIDGTEGPRLTKDDKDVECVESRWTNPPHPEPENVVQKIFPGFVCQRYNADTGKCVGQQFFTDTEGTWENQFGEEIEAPENADYSFLHMEQPMPEGRLPLP